MEKTPQNNLLTRLLFAPVFVLLAIYRTAISPFTAASCRYHPTCSAYMHQAVAQHGVKGVWLGTKRLARCHPWGGHGIDPVPSTAQKEH